MCFIQSTPEGANPFDANAGGSVRSSVRSVIRRKARDKALEAFIGQTGGLDVYGSIEAARRAFIESGAGTDRATVPAGPEAGGASFVPNVDRQRVGAAQLRGLPTIRGR